MKVSQPAQAPAVLSHCRILTVWLLLFPMVAMGAEPGVRYESVLDMSLQLSQEGLGGGASTLAPLMYDEDSLLFTDVRGGAFYNEFVAFSWGLGLRQRTANDWIVGGYAYFDRAHLSGATVIHQGLFGLELMNVDWAFRVNGYLPESETEQINGPQAAVVDGRMVLERPIRGALPGTDFEAGYLLRDWDRGAIELRGYVGGYAFSRSQDRFETIAGPRIRSELRLYDVDWLGPQSRVVIAGQYQWDRVRGAQGLLSIGLRTALGNKTTSRLSRVQRRMVNPVVRQPGVTVGDGSWFEPARIQGQGYRSVTLIDARTPNPTELVSRAGEQSLVVFRGDAGPIEVSQTFRLSREQDVAGGPGRLRLVGERSGQTADYVVGGQRALVRGLDPTRDVFQLGETGSDIFDLDITGGRNGIVGVGVSDYTIAGNHITGSVRSSDPALSERTGNGILLDQPGRDGDIRENQIHQHHVGLRVLGNFQGQVFDNQANDNRHTGIRIDGRLEGHLLNNQSSRNGVNGVHVRGRVTGRVSENTAADNGGSGVRIEGSVMHDVSGNTLAGNGGYGLLIDGFVIRSLENNTATGNGEWGVFASDVRHRVYGNVVSDNRSGGLRLGHVEGNVEGNTAHGNGLQGILTWNVKGHILRNEVSENGQRNQDEADAGLQVIGSIGGSLFQNRADDNRGEGIHLFLTNQEDLWAAENLMGGNNGGQAEFVVEMKPGHTLPATVLLSDNRSSNVVPAGTANYQRLDPQVLFVDGGGNVGIIGF